MEDCVCALLTRALCTAAYGSNGSLSFLVAWFCDPIASVIMVRLYFRHMNNLP
ncbi:uncharacterized protein ASPGLDRAFT_191230 [Aspergillus glaucus CBS 516.65]|uniref:Uncharacterized protein n=1 Tax=Aspergillus glaucus CBS 516.65 TaxID=1160497 RepID=A0A1L9VYQ0_ASPGL|nr:hypothetical protein ASPGLDRAFT_191230 [Aspergillus glaucus CBS 516.65]OJJ89041.1 hypothetical protein ASPGLDRAFT_191230 [Aspergillus glaucus CBS 516.65]